jgi:hypothetical protein
MCEVCRAEGENYLFKNGTKKMLISNSLYKVLQGAVAPVTLCYVHSIELFCVGERRFIQEHLAFARILGARRRSQSREVDSNFGI